METVSIANTIAIQNLKLPQILIISGGNDKSGGTSSNMFMDILTAMQAQQLMEAQKMGLDLKY